MLIDGDGLPIPPPGSNLRFKGVNYDFEGVIISHGGDDRDPNITLAAGSKKISRESFIISNIKRVHELEVLEPPKKKTNDGIKTSEC